MANDTKEKILDAALEMFSKNGYAGTNIRELSASLGLVKSGVYKHYEQGSNLECAAGPDDRLLRGTFRLCRASAADSGFFGGIDPDDDADGELHRPR